MPVVDQFGFLILATAFAHQCHRDELTVADLGCRPWPFEQRPNLLLDIVDDDAYPTAETVKVACHGHVLQLVYDRLDIQSVPHWERFRQVV